jgi:hypothetical protein
MGKLRNSTANYVLSFLIQKQISTLTLCKCIVGCIFNSVGIIITREIPCILFVYCKHFLPSFLT